MFVGDLKGHVCRREVGYAAVHEVLSVGMESCRHSVNVICYIPVR